MRLKGCEVKALQGDNEFKSLMITYKKEYFNNLGTRGLTLKKESWRLRNTQSRGVMDLSDMSLTAPEIYHLEAQRCLKMLKSMMRRLSGDDQNINKLVKNFVISLGADPSSPTSVISCFGTAFTILLKRLQDRRRQAEEQTSQTLPREPIQVQKSTNPKKGKKKEGTRMLKRLGDGAKSKPKKTAAAEKPKRKATAKKPEKKATAKKPKRD